MTTPTPSSAELDTLFLVGIFNNIHEDGTYHITPELMKSFSEKVINSQNLEAQNSLLLSDWRKMKETLKIANDALESFDNIKGGYHIPHSKYCMSERAEIIEEMPLYRTSAMDVCDCYLSEALDAIEQCDKVLSSLSYSDSSNSL